MKQVTLFFKRNPLQGRCTPQAPDAEHTTGGIVTEILSDFRGLTSITCSTVEALCHSAKKGIAIISEETWLSNQETISGLPAHIFVVPNEVSFGWISYLRQFLHDFSDDKLTDKITVIPQTIPVASNVPVKCVLVVTPDQRRANSINKFFTARLMEVHCALTPIRALDEIERDYHPDIVIYDANSPQLSIKEFKDQAKRMSYKDFALIAFGKKWHGNSPHYADRYLDEPFVHSELGETVRILAL